MRPRVARSPSWKLVGCRRSRPLHRPPALDNACSERVRDDGARETDGCGDGVGARVEGAGDRSAGTARTILIRGVTFRRARHRLPESRQTMVMHRATSRRSNDGRANTGVIRWFGISRSRGEVSLCPQHRRTIKEKPRRDCAPSSLTPTHVADGGRRPPRVCARAIGCQAALREPALPNARSE